MPQEKIGPETTAKLFKLYGWVRKAERQGMDYQEINDEINRLVGAKYKIHGQAGLEKALGIYDEEKAAAERVAQKGRGEKLTESAMNVGDAMLFGYGAEAAGLAAGAGAAMVPGGQGFGQAYQETQAGADQLIQGARETSGLAAGIGRGTGMAAPSLLGGVAMGGGRAAATGSLPLRAKMVRGVGTGAAGMAGGAFEGASDPNAEGGRMGGAGRGAMWGGALGLGLGLGIPLVGAGVGAIGSKVGSATQPARKRAMGLLANMMEGSKMPPGTLPELMDDLPAGSAIADLSGSLRRKARAIKNMSPDLEDTIELEGLERRSAATGERMIEGMRGAADLPPGYSSKKVFKAGRLQWLDDHLNPMLEANPYIEIPGLKELAKRNPQVAKALKYKKVNMEDPLFANLWGTRQRLQRLGKLTDKIDGDDLQLIWDGEKELLTLMEEAHAGTREMMGQYRHIKAVEDAYEIGESVGSQSVHELGEAMDDLNLAEPEIAEGFKQGLAAWFEKGLEDTLAGGAVASKLQKLTPRMRARVKALFGGKDRDLQGYIEDTLRNQERRWSKLHRALVSNSSSPQQLSDMEGVINDPTRAPAIRDFINRAYLIVNTSPGTRRETLLELGKLTLDTTMTPAQIRLLSDAMSDMMVQQGFMRRRVIAAAGGMASEAGQGLFGSEVGPAPQGLFAPAMPNDAGPQQGLLPQQ